MRHAARRLCQWVGLASISESMRQASVLGDRRPCSQERTVDGSTPRNPAKAAWLVPSRSRTLRHVFATVRWRRGDSISSHGEPCLQRLCGSQSLGEFAQSRDDPLTLGPGRASGFLNGLSGHRAAPVN